MKNHIKNIYCYSQLIELPHFFLLNLYEKIDYPHLHGRQSLSYCFQPNLVNQLFKTPEQKQFLLSVINCEYYLNSIRRKIVVQDPIPKACLIQLKNVLQKKLSTNTNINYTILDVIKITQNWNSAQENDFLTFEEFQILCDIASIFFSHNIRFKITIMDQEASVYLASSIGGPAPMGGAMFIPFSSAIVSIPTIAPVPPIIIKQKKKKK